MLHYLLALILLFQPLGALLAPDECFIALEFSYTFKNTDEVRVVTSDAESLNFMGQNVTISYTVEPVKENRVLNWSIKGDGSFKISYDVWSERYELKDFSGNLSDLPKMDRYLGKSTVSVSGRVIDFIDPEDESIRAKAIEIAGGEESIYQIGRKLYDWIVENVRYNNRAETYPQSAAETLKKRSGDCDEQTALFISMARSLGVPSFYMDGYVIDRVGSYPAGHAWAGVIKWNDKGYEIFPVDTVYREFGVKRANKIFVDYDRGTEGYMSTIYNDVRYWYGSGERAEVTYEVRCKEYTTSANPIYYVRKRAL
jgi:hypothetical protein